MDALASKSDLAAKYAIAPPATTNNNHHGLDIIARPNVLIALPTPLSTAVTALVTARPAIAFLRSVTAFATVTAIISVPIVCTNNLTSGVLCVNMCTKP